MSDVSPLLTIAIPTWNRAAYLAQNLAQLRSELSGKPLGQVEVLVSDNNSPDSTPAVVQNATQSGMSIRYVRNDKNLGWALNFAQCFDLARGKYVLLLGDDDLLVDGALALVLSRLVQRDYGVVCLRPYGFDEDFRTEYPGGSGGERIFRDANQFLITINKCFTLTSACVLNKSLLCEVDSRQFATADLAMFHLMLRAALAAKENLFIEKYLIASKRQNSFAYDYGEVFVDQFWRIIDAHVAYGLRPELVRTLERQRILSYYPFYLLDLRLSGRGDLSKTRAHFANRFRKRWLFTCWLAPILLLPRPLAIAWGSVTTVIGRVLGGQLRRGVVFAWRRLVRSLSSKEASSAGQMKERGLP